jgi:hypothetical protein
MARARFGAVVLACAVAAGSGAKQIGTLMSAASPEYFLAVFSDNNDQFVAGLHESSRGFVEAGDFLEFSLGRGVGVVVVVKTRQPHDACCG